MLRYLTSIIHSWLKPCNPGVDNADLLVLSPGVVEEGGGWAGVAIGIGVIPGTGVTAGLNCGVGDACEPVHAQNFYRLSRIYQTQRQARDPKS